MGEAGMVTKSGSAISTGVVSKLAKISVNSNESSFFYFYIYKIIMIYNFYHSNMNSFIYFYIYVGGKERRGMHT